MVLSAFESYFIGQYGPQRWAKILTGLSRSRTAAAVGVLLNNSDAVDLVERTPGVELLGTEWPPGTHHEDLQLIVPSGMGTLEEEKDVFLPPPPQTSSGTLAWYWMDMASLIPPLLLDVQPGHDVLDACAAPGGKSCILGRMLFRHDGFTQGSLTCNEPSAKRRQKLQSVLASYFGSSYMDSRRIMVTGRPAEKKFEWRRRGSRRLFDRILIDAPCTHERHVLGQSATGVAGIQKDSWSIARCKRMAALQVRMVIAGIQSLKDNGRLVYSTCSLDNEKQNDGVIDKVCAKISDVHVVSHEENIARIARAIPVQHQQSSIAMGQVTPTRHGWMAMPHEQLGWGPMYMSVLQKAS